MIYSPENYWKKRLSDGFSLSKVGHLGFSEYYNKWLYKAKIRAFKKALLSEHIDIHNATVCDIGCGTGFFVEFYKFQGAKEIVGVDITTVSVENLKQQYPKYNFVKEDISSPLLVPKINRKFDLLNVFDVLYHIIDDKLFGQAITNICSLTNDNGSILITDLFGSKDINSAEHVKFRSKEAYETALEKNSAKLLAIYPLYFFLNRPLFGKFRITILRKIGMKMDNLFVPIYYLLDKIFLSPKRSNLSLIAARKVKL
jgi:SAM-dependent methyltransferase